VRALPIIVSLSLAAALAPSVLRALRAGGHMRPNYRGRKLPAPLGVLILIAGAAALMPLALAQRLTGASVLPADELSIAAFIVGAGALGLIDDAFGGDGPRGVRGHAAAALRGRLSTGAIKAAGVTGLALLAAGGMYTATERWLIAAALLTLCTHVFNLLDLRPGRASKALLALCGCLAAVTASLRPLLALGAFLGPALVAGVLDLRERAMLGDTGAGMLGAIGGLWMAMSLPPSAQEAAILALAALAVYGELRSIGAFVERVPGLRQLDSWGRP